MPNKKKSIKKIFIIAGEPSGDLLGSRLMHAMIDDTKGKIKFSGIGGTSMNSIKGFKSTFDISDIAVMGLTEVLSKVSIIKKRIKQTVLKIQKEKPDCIITIDSPGFCKRVVNQVKAKGLDIPCVHYVAPQVWAWKEDRAEGLAKTFDHLLCFFPFEPKYFEKFGLSCSVVGHPVIERVKGNKSEFFKAHPSLKGNKILTVLPGSRKGEVKRMFPVFKKSIKLIQNEVPNLKVIIPVVNTVEKLVIKKAKKLKVETIIIKGEENRYNAFASSDLAIATSGTVTLELSVMNIPTIMSYKISRLSYAIMKRFVKLKYFSLVNILNKKLIIKEFIQHDANAKTISSQAVKYLKSKKATDKIKKDLKQGCKILSVGKTPPSKLASKAVLDFIKSYK